MLFILTEEVIKEQTDNFLHHLHALIGSGKKKKEKSQKKKKISRVQRLISTASGCASKLQGFAACVHFKSPYKELST